MDQHTNFLSARPKQTNVRKKAASHSLTRKPHRTLLERTLCTSNTPCGSNGVLLIIHSQTVWNLCGTLSEPKISGKCASLQSVRPSAVLSSPEQQPSARRREWKLASKTGSEHFQNTSRTAVEKPLKAGGWRGWGALGAQGFAWPPSTLRETARASRIASARGEVRFLASLQSFCGSESIREG